MKFSTCVLFTYLISAELLSSSHAGLLLNLLLGGNNGAPQGGSNLPFLNYNNNQNAPNDYPDYNIGTSRDENFGRVNDYDTSQQQNYIPNEPSGNFNQQPESFNQNDYSDSQERDYNRNPSNFNDEELRIGRPNIPSTNTLNNNPENNLRQITNRYNDGKNINKISNGDNMINENGMSKNNEGAPSQKPMQFNDAEASQNITMNNNRVPSKFHLNDSNMNSINHQPSLDKIMNSSNIDTHSATVVVVTIPAEVSINNKITENTAKTTNIIKRIAKNLLKPITKRKFFFQVKPVMPEPNRVRDMETVFYIE